MKKALLATCSLLLAVSAVNAAGVKVLSMAGDPVSTLEADRSDIEVRPGAGPRGGQAVAWTSIEWRAKLTFKSAGNADFGRAQKLVLQVNSGNWRGKVLYLIASSSDNEYDTFSYPVNLTWEGWHDLEVPLLRFVRNGQALWPNMNQLHLEYSDTGEGGEILLGDVVLLREGESLDAPPPPLDDRPGVTDRVLEDKRFDDFEEGTKSLLSWDPTDSKAEIGFDKVKSGKWALRWFGGKAGATLEYLDGPFSLQGYDAISLWVHVERPLATGLYLALGNDPSNLAWGRMPALGQGWNEVKLEIGDFKTRGDLSLHQVRHFLFLYEGGAEVRVIFDDIRFLATGAGPAPHRPTPGPSDPSPGPGRRLVRDAAGNVVVYGPGVSARPSADRSRVTRTTEDWYTCGRGSSLKWYGLSQRSGLSFTAVPADVSPYASLSIRLYSDSPVGELELTWIGDEGEAALRIPVDWIGWKEIDLDVSRFRRLASAGQVEQLVFRFEARPRDMREFYIDDIRLMKR